MPEEVKRGEDIESLKQLICLLLQSEEMEFEIDGQQYKNRINQTEMKAIADNVFDEFSELSTPSPLNSEVMAKQRNDFIRYPPQM